MEGVLWGAGEPPPRSFSPWRSRCHHVSLCVGHRLALQTDRLHALLLPLRTLLSSNRGGKKEVVRENGLF